MLHRLTRDVTNLPFRRPGAIILVATLLAMVSGLGSALFLKWNADPDELASRNSSYLKDARAFKQEFGDLDCVFVVVGGKGEVAQKRACVDRLERELRKIPELAEIHASVGPKDQLRLASRAMPIEDLGRLVDGKMGIASLVAGEGPAALLQRAEEMFGELVEKNLFIDEVRQKELGTSALLLLNALAGGVDNSASRDSLVPLLRDETDRQYLTNDNGALYFVRILPKREHQSLYVVHLVLDKIRGTIDRVGKEFSGVEIGLTGKQVLLSDQMVCASRDMTLATAASTVLVWVLFIFALRGLLGPVFAMAALGMGICITFGVTTLFIGELTLLSAAFTPVLVGIGIDFGIHLLMRYQEERRSMPAEQALRHAQHSVTRGNLIGGATTCAAFMTAMLTGSPGFSQLGFVSGSGVVFCMLAMTLVLPAIVLMHLRISGSSCRHGKCASFSLPLPARSLFGPILVSFAAVTVLAGVMIPRVGFRDNVLELQPPNLPSVQWEERILSEGNSTLFGAIIARDLDQVPDVVERLQRLPTVGAVHSVLDAVAPGTPERESLRGQLAELPTATAGLATVPLDPARVEYMSRSLRAFEVFARGRSPKDADVMRQLSSDLGRLAEALRAPDPELVARVNAGISLFCGEVSSALRAIVEGSKLSLRDSLPESVRPMLMSAGGSFLVMAHPKENIWEFENLEAFVSDLQSVDPASTGFPVTHLGTVNDLRTSFYWSSILALFVVTFVVWLDCRCLISSFLSMVPLTISLLWTLGWMGWVGMDFNLVNFIGVPILIGIGVDNGVHIVHHFRHRHQGATDLGSTGTAVLMTSATNMVGFGSLMLSSHRGAQSLGLIMLVGCALTMLASTMLLPALAMYLVPVAPPEPAPEPLPLPQAA